MMGISSNSAVVETYRDNEGQAAIANISPAMNGCGMAIYIPNCGKDQFWLCQKHGARFIVMIPGSKWVQDMKDDGFEVIAPIDNVPTNKEAQP